MVEGWSGATNGWTFAGIGADGALGAGSVIESPRWPKAEILTATITLCCSTNQPNRFVEVSFLYDDDLPTRAIRVGAVARAHGEIFRTRVDFVRPEGNWTLEAFTNFETNRTLRATFSCSGRVVSDFWSGRRIVAESGSISLEIPACDTVLLKTCLIESRSRQLR